MSFVQSCNNNNNNNNNNNKKFGKTIALKGDLFPPGTFLPYVKILIRIMTCSP